MMLYEWILYMIITWACMIVLHELAHQKELRKLGRNSNLHWEKGCIVCGNHASYKGLTKKQLYQIYSMGVYAGMIPVLFACILFHPIYVSMLLPYIGWSWHDLKNMIRCRR